MNTKTILAILVVLLFISSCTDLVRTGSTLFGKENTSQKPGEKTGTVVDTKVTVPVEPGMKEQEEPLPDYPVTLTAKKLGDKVNLSWTPYSGKFMSYKIVRSTTDPNPKYPGADLIETISDINTVTFTDLKAQPGVNYYAIGVLTITHKGDMSNVASVEFPDPKEKQGNKITLTAVKTPEGVNLTWNAYTDGPLMYYKVVRSDTNPNPKYPNDIGIAAQPYIDRTSYLDRSVKPGRTYYYALTVVRRDYTRYTSAPVTVTT
jgi:hypothetical protein